MKYLPLILVAVVFCMAPVIKKKSSEDAPATGACCYADGSCDEELEEATCLGGSGTWNEGLTCAQAACPQPPEPTGACCYADGSCAEELEEATCLGGSGTWKEGTACAQAACPQPSAECSPPSDIALIFTGDGCDSPPCTATSIGGVYEFDSVKEFPIGHTATLSDGNVNYPDDIQIIASTPIGTGPGVWLRGQRDIGAVLMLSDDLFTDTIADPSDIQICAFEVYHMTGGSFSGYTLNVSDASVTTANYRHIINVSRLGATTLNRFWDNQTIGVTSTFSIWTNYLQAGGSRTFKHYQHGTLMITNGSTGPDSRLGSAVTPQVFLGSRELAQDIPIDGYVDSVFVSVGPAAACRCGDTASCAAAGLTSADTFFNQIITNGMDTCESSYWNQN